MTTINDLPTELLPEILQYVCGNIYDTFLYRRHCSIELVEKLALRRVSRRFYDALNWWVLMFENVSFTSLLVTNRGHKMSLN